MYVQCKPLNVITLGHAQTDNYNQMIIITESSQTLTNVFRSISDLLDVLT